MKQHLALVFLLGLLHTTRGGFLDWIRGETVQPDGHKVGKVHVEVLSPKGLRLWAHYNPDTVQFGVELYVKYYGGKTEALECAMCNSTDEPVDGKFMLEDANLVARFGDVLQYTVITVDGTTTKRHPVRRVFVREELIKPIGRCVCRDQPPTSPLQTGRRISNVQLLERMILRVLSNHSESCEAISNWLVLRSEPRNELGDVEEYVRLYLDMLYLRAKKTSLGFGRDWSPSASVLKVEDHSDGIAFQVRSTMDKLKILELLNSDGILLDYDGIL